MEIGVVKGIGAPYRDEVRSIHSLKSFISGVYLSRDKFNGQKPICYLNLGNLMDVQERHIIDRKCRDPGVHGQFDRSNLLREMTVGVGRVCSLTSEVLAILNKSVPPPANFDWRGWFRAGRPFFREDMTLRCSALILPYGSR
ncbi:hypothetical protein J6590_051807 [Homalodisca vitripennis]|nr:hypothetical protein J6590_051807 [Homalodisca vitripennis]